MRNSGLALVAGVLLSALLAGCAGQCPEITGGIVYVRDGNYQKAVELLEKGIQIEPDNWKGHYHLAVAYTELRRYSDAYPHWQKAQELNPGNKEIEQRHYAYWYDHFMPGVTALKAREYDEAEKLFVEAIEINPKRTDAFSNLAFAYGKTGQMERGLEVYDQLLEIDPENVDALESKGQVQRALKRCDQAVLTWKKMVEIDPGKAQIWRDIGDCYTEIGETAEAIAAYEKAAQAMPNDASIPFGLGVIYYKNDDYAQAATYFLSAAQASNPGDGIYEDALFNRAQMQFRLEDFEGAKNTMMELIEAKPDVAEYYDFLGRIYFRLGNNEEGMRMFEKAKALEDKP